MVTDTDEYFMEEALLLAQKASSLGEVPVGAVVVLGSVIIGRGYNQMVESSDPTAHAEIIALRDASVRLGNYRLPGSIIYATLEPCCMCSGAVFHARISEFVYGTPDPKAGCAGGCIDLTSHKSINHHTKFRGGILQKKCQDVLTKFFHDRRGRN